jgi:hypothetical protein
MELRSSRTIRATTGRYIDSPDKPFVNWANAIEPQARNLRAQAISLVAIAIVPTTLVSTFFANGGDSLD